jgi:hypothetical protein
MLKLLGRRLRKSVSLFQLYIDNCIPEEVKILHLYSDSCAGKNKNLLMA